MESTPPKIFPVKDPEEQYLNKKGLPPVHPHLPQIDGYGGGACLLMISPVKTGKCLAFFTLVETTNGNKYIKDVKVGDEVLSDKGYVKVTEKFYQGKKKCFTITLENNNELILTEEHKLHTLDGMKQMKDCVDDMIITKTGMSKIKSKELFGELDCYDITVDSEDHRFYANNISVSNSTIVSNLLLSSDFYDAQERFDSTHIISNTIANDVTSRYLREAFDTYDQYNDSIIDGIVEKQKEYAKEEQPEIAVVVDDCLGSIKREGRINHLASRFRHFNIRLLVISSQNFRAVSPIIRQNATNVIVGSPFPNRKELLKIAEEYGDLFGGPEKWIALYKKATPERYNFIHMNLQANPPEMYRNFDELIAVGEKDMISISQKDIVEEEKLKKDNVEENVESK